MSTPHTLLELTSKLQDGTITPGDALEGSLNSIAEAEASVRAWVRVDQEGAFAQALCLERVDGSKPPLWGVPVAVKDLIDVRGLPTGCGSSLKGQSPALEDADCVRLLRDAGAVVLGKTVTTEFGYFSPGPTRNPVNLEHTPGGSSSGSAAAVAAGMVSLAIGTQTAGSLTRPASYCGVAGYVATQGEFSMTGITGLSGSLDSLGLLARRVSDLRYVWAALSQHGAVETYEDSDQVDVLLWNGSGLDELTPDMEEALEHMSSILSGSRDIHPVPWRDHELIQGLARDHATVMAAEAAVERSDEMLQSEALSLPLRELLKQGHGISQDEYRAAVERIAAARRKFLTLLESFDAVLGPAALGAAPIGIDATGSPILSRPWQAMGLPVVTIPGLRNGSGMPLGVQLIGVPGQEAKLFRIGERIEEVILSSAGHRYPSSSSSPSGPCGFRDRQQRR